jgi:CheY-like chemotaxis protein
MAGVSRFGTSKSGASVPRILVADDNSNIQKMVALAFQDHGIEVIAVGNGEAAVRKMPDLNPDVVLADVFMPVRNGYEVCEFIKKDPRFSKIPVILLVGAFDPLDEAEARRVGADGILKKPFVPPDPLIAMVTSVMAKAPKPEPKAEAPVLEIPKPPPPPPPAAFPQFPDPAPEEEAYTFGTGRRSLEDDEGAAGAGQTAHVAVTSAAEFSTEHFASAEEEAGASETSVDWRRRDEVNSAEVPSFSAALMDEPAAQSLPESNATEPLVADTAPDAPILTEEPNPEPPSSESFMRAFAGAFDDPPPVQAQVEVEEPAAPASPAWLKPLEDSLQSDKAFTDLMAPELANPALANPVPADRGEWNLTERAETTLETTFPATEERALPEVQNASPASGPAASRAAREFFAHEVPPPESPAVETPEPESFAFESAAAETAPRSTLDAIHFPPESVAPGTPPSQASEAESVEQATAWAGAFGPAQAAPSKTAATEAAGIEAAGIEGAETPAAEFESVARVEEIEEIEALASPVAILESAGIAPREIGRMATVETSVVASDVAPEVQSIAAPAAVAIEPEPAPAAPAAEVEVAPAAKPITEPAPAPQIPAIFAQPDSQMLPVEAVPEPAASSAAQAETAVASAPAQPAPSVDEVVARVLEKLAPQLQELLSKNLVRPLVEDLMHKTGEKK